MVDRTLVELLGRRAAEAPGELAFGFLADGEADLRVLTRAELDAGARRVACALADRVAEGGRVILLYEPGLAFVTAFFGCLYAGVVAVPAYPPLQPAGRERVAAVAADCGAEAVLTSEFLRETVAGALPLIVTDGPARDGSAWRDPGVDPDTVAFIQYTSGSTAAPRGVVLTHANLLANQRAIGRALHVPGDAVVASWLPMYHDMGLIGTILYPLYHGAPCYLMSPLHFLQRPARWLELISAYGVSVSGGPNFAYDLCARRVTDEELAALDLSTWQVAFSGAEPIRAATFRRFTDRFAPCGLRPEALVGCYGLAEATLLVTGAGPDDRTVLTADRAALEQGRLVPAAGRETTELVPSGRVAPDHDLLIVDPSALVPCPDGQVGEIWVRGPSVAAGYWKRPDDDFRAFLSGGEGPYLRTGDLGLLWEGRLYVTGRIKDLLIVRGRSIHPHDVEDAACVAGGQVRRGAGVAFALAEGVALVQETTADDGALGPLAGEIRTAVLRDLGVRLDAIYLVPKGTVPKTSSGKVRRGAARAAVLAGTVPVRFESREGRWT
ncbi:nonribosomal peptide synthetase protein BlmVI [Nonomuraea solani]|uniref:Nonribosomal peptide synthetase protein BlmVI n=1 Tax=Nonomuraea solani TaxID=1144553 RepID=A0A1H6EWQ9_9ACTN|nr:fatty acyl-AMP ligase [Nonomuraea solani]SEH01853.1 nonribosomal peptide synthetase protein BlmVI [Nonomuraea solani]